MNNKNIDDIDKNFFRLQSINKKELTKVEKEYHDYIIIRMILYIIITIGSLILILMFLNNMFFLIIIYVLIFNLIFCVYVLFLEAKFYKFINFYSILIDFKKTKEDYPNIFKMILYTLFNIICIGILVNQLLNIDLPMLLFIFSISMVCIFLLEIYNLEKVFTTKNKNQKAASKEIDQK